tara:strand:+ start:37742 stop:37942 length:201 start_codon:yes stop_codon:yes gene_type:complete
MIKVFGIMFIDSINTLKTGILLTTIRFSNLVVCNNHEIPIKIKKIRKKDFNICDKKYISIFLIILL